MRIATATATELNEPGHRLDGSYHASDGMNAVRFLRQWAKSDSRSKQSLHLTVREPRQTYGENRLDLLEDISEPDGIFIGGRAKRIYVSDNSHGVIFLSSSDMLQATFEVANLISKKQPGLDSMILQEGWTLISRSGTVGNMTYARKDMAGLAGSEHIMRVVCDRTKVLPGYIYAFLSSNLGKALVKLGTYGTVVDTISVDQVGKISVPRLTAALEKQVHDLIQTSADLRSRANEALRSAEARFLVDVLKISPNGLHWSCKNEHAFATGTAVLSMKHHRLDAFHYVGYVQEAEDLLKDTVSLGELISPYQPPVFKRPYTDETGIPFLSGMDLYNAYPKPRLYISRKMPNLDRYLVEAGTILVQNVGQRYGLFGRPTILQKHLDGVSVTQHLMRVYPKDSRDRGFVYIWLSTEVGRRLLLKQSFGTSMGVLFEHSFREMPAPKCSAALRHSFESEVQAICDYRDKANELEDEAQSILLNALGWDETVV